MLDKSKDDEREVAEFSLELDADADADVLAETEDEKSELVVEATEAEAAWEESL